MFLLAEKSAEVVCYLILRCNWDCRSVRGLNGILINMGKILNVLLDKGKDVSSVVGYRTFQIHW